jgi:hypothetical protein
MRLLLCLLMLVTGIGMLAPLTGCGGSSVVHQATDNVPSGSGGGGGSGDTGGTLPPPPPF